MLIGGRSDRKLGGCLKKICGEDENEEERIINIRAELSPRPGNNSVA